MQNSLPAIAYDIPAAVAVSGIGRTKLFEAMKHGQLKARKFGRRVLILPDDLKAFVESLPEREAA